MECDGNAKKRSISENEREEDSESLLVSIKTVKRFKQDKAKNAASYQRNENEKESNNECCEINGVHSTPSIIAKKPDVDKCPTDVPTERNHDDLNGEVLASPNQDTQETQPYELGNSQAYVEDEVVLDENVNPPNLLDTSTDFENDSGDDLFLNVDVDKLLDGSGEDEEPAEINERPTGINEEPTEINKGPTGISEEPTGINEEPTGMKGNSRIAKEDKGNDIDEVIVITPQPGIVDLTENSYEGVNSLKKIPSLHKDAEQIASLLNLPNIDDVYDKLFKHRLKANRVEIVTNNILEETVNSSSKSERKNITDVASINRTDVSESGNNDSSSESETFAAIFGDLDEVKYILKQRLPKLIIDPNLIYAELEANSHHPDRVNYVVDLVLKAQQSSKQDEEDMDFEQNDVNRAEVCSNVETNENDSQSKSQIQSELVDEVDIILKRFPTADQNDVYCMLRERKDFDDRLEQVIDKLLEKTKRDTMNELHKSKQSMSRSGHKKVKSPIKIKPTKENDDELKVSSEEEELMNTDPIYRDTCYIAKLFPDRDKNEIYAYLEAYHDRANRIAIVTDELLRLQEWSQENRPAENIDKNQGKNSRSSGSGSTQGNATSCSTSEQTETGHISTDPKKSNSIVTHNSNSTNKNNQPIGTNSRSTSPNTPSETPNNVITISKTQKNYAELKTPRAGTFDDPVTVEGDEVAMDVIENEVTITSAPDSTQQNLHPDLQIPIAEEELQPLVRLEKDVETMRDVFPDCDPMWLYEQLAQRHGDENRVELLSQIMMENRLYPKLKERIQKEKQEKARNRVRNMTLNMLDFLGMFPDPITHFYSEESNVSEAYKIHCRIQLRNDFPYASSGFIDSVLREHNGHYTSAYQELVAAQGERLSSRTKKQRSRFRTTHRVSEPMPEEPDEYFYRELLFVTHEQEISAYLRRREEEKAKRLTLAKENNLLVECGCCYDDEVLPEDSLCCPADHMFCKECIRRSSEEVVGQAKIKFPCLSGDCELEFDIATLKKALSAKVFSNVLRKIQEEELRQADIPNLVACPFCSFATIMENPDDRIFKCLNPECLKESCRLCREPSHIPLRCDEVERQGETNMRTFIENKMTEAMLRECYRCKKRFYKTEGCNKMTCTCGASMCYVCRQPVRGYEHFGPQGCPQDTDVFELHRQEMEKAAHEARQRYTDEHPEAGDATLKHDPLQHLDGEGSAAIDYRHIGARPMFVFGQPPGVGRMQVPPMPPPMMPPMVPPMMPMLPAPIPPRPMLFDDLQRLEFLQQYNNLGRFDFNQRLPHNDVVLVPSDDSDEED